MFYQSKGLSSFVGVFLIVVIDIGIYSTVVLKFCVFSPRYCCFHVYITCLHVYRTVLTLFLLLVSSQNLIILTYELECFVNVAKEINYVALRVIRSQLIYNLIILRISTTDFH